jgi:hypothetical protein
MRLARATCVLLACGAAACRRETPVSATKEPMVVVSAGTTRPHEVDSVTFVARIRPDIAARLKTVDHPGDPAEGVPHIVGWQWIADLGEIDPWTKACATRELTCTIMVHGSGTMVFSVRLATQVCADWVHVETRNVPNVDETDSLPRLRADSVEAAIRTKVPSWPRCTA